jgi:hypothetical protein
MQPSISSEQNHAWIADLRHQAQQEGLSAAAACTPPGRPEPRRGRLRAGLNGISAQLWTLLHAQTLLAGPAAGAGGVTAAEDDYRRFAASPLRPARR